jgi:lysophospholipid acyltransferase (LPLAT)-like uncharacterized protein
LRLPGLEYDSPYAFSTSQKIQLALIPPIISILHRCLLHTCAIEVRGAQNVEAALHAAGHAIVAVWHENLGICAFQNRNLNYYTMTSYSFDGELAARVVRYFGNEAVRGSSSRGGLRGLVQLKKALQQVPIVALTPDGPRGPRRTAAPGTAMLSASTQTPIIPNAYAISRCRRLNSWDRFAVPKTFSKIICAFGEPIQPPSEKSREAIVATSLELQTALNQLQHALESELGDIQDIE